MAFVFFEIAKRFQKTQLHIIRSPMPDSPSLTPPPIDQLVLIVVPDEQAGELGKALVAAGFRLTVISASNGFLPSGSNCLMLGIAAGDAPRLLGLVEKVCKTRRRYIPTSSPFSGLEGAALNMIEAEVGSANVYTFAVESFEYL
jgi:uncharacterized protein YaaQ